MSPPLRSSLAAILAATALAPAGATLGVEDGFDRYAVILSRMPFGEAPIEEAPPAKPSAPAAESFARALRVCSITKPDGDGPIRVDIVDKAANNAVYMLREGVESPEGITLVSANLLEEEAVIQKGDEIALLKLGEEPTKISPSDLAKRRATSSPQATSYADRRRQRREALIAQRTSTEQAERPPPKYTGEQLRQHLQEYNMEAIRQGLPALPIELTPEQDSQLVKEGVLPPSGAVAMPSVQDLAPLLDANEAGSVPASALIEDLPAELRDLKIEDLSAEELQLLLQ